MKNLGFVFAIVAFVGWAWGEPVRIDDVSIPFLYESGVSPEERFMDDELFAGLLSETFKRSRDEFERHDLMQKIKPVVDKRMAEAAAAKEVKLVVGSRLGDYDFEEEAFTTGLRATSFMEYELGFAVMFENGGELAFLPVTKESARSLGGELQRDRGVTITLVGEIAGREHRKLNGIYKRVLYVSVNRMEVVLRSGREVGLKEVQGKGGVLTCAELKAECGPIHEACIEKCQGVEDVVERLFCAGECRDSRGRCEDRC